VSLLETVTNLSEGCEILRLRRYGVIEVVDGSLRRVLLRPFPKIATGPEVLLLGRWYHRYRSGDRIFVYYNQPWRFPNFLALKYVVSARDATMRSVCRAQEVLMEIARLKRSDAVLCDAANWRISARLMARWGWEPHCPSRWHRHFIKRFYGEYPPCANPGVDASLNALVQLG
jgi:hypothetical protein